jgi:cation diffusion facilitator CzcD-associated flavoprotein CzcO
MDEGRDTDREPLEVAILGAGFGGLCMGARLLEAGIRDFVILEKDAEVGGTWRDNTYPGAACDVQSHLYSLSFDPKPDWTERYAGWREIQQYVLDATQRLGLRPFIRFGGEVCGAHFDAAAGCWTVELRGGERIRARHFVMASGPLHRPHVPPIPGLERFEGKVFHSARWDHGYDLAGRRVAAIGTGASAAQYCPQIAPRVARLHVFQRTPGWVMPRDTRQYPARVRRRYARFPWLRRLHRARLYWFNESRVWPLFYPALARLPEAFCRLFLRSQVRDPALRRKLTPRIRFGCKRVLLSNDWYPMFSRPNVELVTAGIREVRARSVVTDDGVERPVDCIVLGTGFVVDPRIYLRDFPVTGLPGRDLAADWRAGAEAYYGIAVSGYPNFHQLLGPNTALGHNSAVFMIECQVRYVMDCLRELRARGADYLAVQPGAQRRFNERVQRALGGTTWSSGCTSWYQQSDGRNFTIWPWSTWRYWLETRRMVAGDFDFVRVERDAAG